MIIQILRIFGFGQRIRNLSYLVNKLNIMGNNLGPLLSHVWGINFLIAPTREILLYIFDLKGQCF